MDGWMDGWMNVHMFIRVAGENYDEGTGCDIPLI
jgi:hypothetical protein